MNRITLVAILIILLIGGLLRLYRIDNPVADWHAWRQADTAAVAKIYTQNGIDFLHPRYYDISNVQSGLDNPEGYRFVEFPLYAALHAFLYNTIGLFTFDMWGRLISVIASLTTALMLFLILRSHNEEKTGLLAALFFAVLPFSIYYGRVILPEPMLLAFITSSIYLFKKWTNRKNLLYFTLSLVLLSLALLLKPTAAFFLPVYAVIAIQAWQIEVYKNIYLYIYAALSVIPLILWRLHVANFPEGVPAFLWLLNEGGLRFKGAFFYWIFGERIGKLILGYFGTSVLALGILSRRDDKSIPLMLAFLASGLLYVTVFARGNVQHDYYQILLLPTVSILLARGSIFLLSVKGGYNYVTKYVLLFSITLLFVALSWFYVRDYFNINNINIVRTGQAANEILPENAKVIAPLDGDTTLLYYTERKGWPVMQKPIEELIQMGATHMVIANPTENDRQGFGQDYTRLASTDEYLILRLK